MTNDIDEEEDNGDAKARRQKRFRQKSRFINREKQLKFRDERKIYRPKFNWEDFNEDEEEFNF